MLVLKRRAKINGSSEEKGSTLPISETFGLKFLHWRPSLNTVFPSFFLCSPSQWALFYKKPLDLSVVLSKIKNFFSYQNISLLSQGLSRPGSRSGQRKNLFASPSILFCMPSSLTSIHQRPPKCPTSPGPNSFVNPISVETSCWKSPF